MPKYWYVRPSRDMLLFGCRHVNPYIMPSIVVFDRPGRQGVLQIIDFGESVNVSDPNKVYNDFVGTIHYLPPESQGPRTGEDLKKCDLWYDDPPMSQ